MRFPDPTRTLDEVRFHSSAPKRSYLTKREAEVFLSTVDKQAERPLPVRDTDRDITLARELAQQAAK